MVLQVAEISRILKPGGIFVASTFLLPTPAIFADGALKSVRKVHHLHLLTLSFSEIYVHDASSHSFSLHSFSNIPI